jgi:hypothetical protein
MNLHRSCFHARQYVVVLASTYKEKNMLSFSRKDTVFLEKMHIYVHTYVRYGMKNQFGTLNKKCWLVYAAKHAHSDII